MRQYVQLHLTCADVEEADRIVQNLLEKRLIVCAKQVPVTSSNWWEGEIEQNQEILLIMDSVEDLFREVEDEIGPLHSYETFVLQAVPLVGLSLDAQAWVEENLKPYEA